MRAFALVIEIVGFPAAALRIFPVARAVTPGLIALLFFPVLVRVDPVAGVAAQVAEVGVMAARVRRFTRIPCAFGAAAPLALGVLVVALPCLRIAPFAGTFPAIAAVQAIAQVAAGACAGRVFRVPAGAVRFVEIPVRAGGAAVTGLARGHLLAPTPRLPALLFGFRLPVIVFPCLAALARGARIALIVVVAHAVFLTVCVWRHVRAQAHTPCANRWRVIRKGQDSYRAAGCPADGGLPALWRTASMQGFQSL
ncbi:hypothetical protein D9M72_460170 [compost metagenome]